MLQRETDAQKQERIERDLDALRILAWLVQRGRYSAEPMRMEGGRRGKVRIAAFTFHIEAADLREARDAVREIVRSTGTAKGLGGAQHRMRLRPSSWDGTRHRRG